MQFATVAHESTLCRGTPRPNFLWRTHSQTVDVLPDSLRRAAGVGELLPQNLNFLLFAERQQLACHVLLDNIKQRSPAAKYFRL